MRRREFISLIAGATAWPLGVRAQQPPMPVIGILGGVEAEAISGLLAAFRQGLAEAGYVEGKNIAIEYRFANFRPELLPELAGDLVRLNVKIIFAVGPEPLVAARNATDSIPVVAIDLESDPLALGYAKSLGRPGGNITGVFLNVPELSAKQLELLKEVFPRLSRIAIFGDRRINAPQSAAVELAARQLAIQVEKIDVRVPGDIESALEFARTRHVDAGIMLSSPLVYTNRKQIGEFAIAKRLPLISLFGDFPKAGGFMAYGPNMEEAFRICGSYVAKILQGAKPGDLPIQWPEKFDLVINLKTADALSLTISPSLDGIDSRYEMVNAAITLSVPRTMVAASAPANVGLRFDHRQMRTGAVTRRAPIGRASSQHSKSSAKSPADS